MNDDNNSPNNTAGENSHGTIGSSQPKKKSGLFKKITKNSKSASSNSHTGHHTTEYNHSTHQPKKSLKKNFNGLIKAINNNKVTTLVIIIFIAAIAGFSFWYFNSQPAQRVLDTNNQVVNEYKDKLPELKKAASADSNNAAARKNYAVALYVTGNYEAAKNEYEAVVKIDGKDSTAYNNLGNTYRDLGKYDKAKGAYEKSFEINPTSINPYVNLANIQLYTLNDSGAAIATYQKALKAMPNNNQVSLLLGIAYEKAGKTTEAKQTYQDILSRNADDKAAKAGLDRLNK